MLEIPYGDDSLRVHHEFIVPKECDEPKRNKIVISAPKEKPKIISDNWVPFEKKAKCKFNDVTYKHIRIPETEEHGTLKYGVISFLLCTASAAAWANKDQIIALWEHAKSFIALLV
jgi:hypothetical protein